MPRVAIMYYGLLRSVQYTMPNIQKNLYEPLTAEGYEYDVYCHNYVFPEGHKYNNPRAREINQDLMPHPERVLNPTYYSEDNQLEVAAQLDLAGYRTMGDPWPSSRFLSLNNYILSIYSRQRVARMLADNLESGKCAPYDYVFFVRSDVIYERPVAVSELLELLTMESMCLIPNFQHFGGLNDRCFIAKQALALRYGLEYFDMLLDYSKSKLLHSETINKHFIVHHLRATTVLVPLYFARVRSTGEIKNENYH